MYTVQNFRTKKELKDALKSGTEVKVFDPGIGMGKVPENGMVFLEGPHYKTHIWYAEGKVRDGKLVSVK